MLQLMKEKGDAIISFDAGFLNSVFVDLHDFFPLQVFWVSTHYLHRFVRNGFSVYRWVWWSRNCGIGE